MQISISNDKLKATFSTKGAELQSMVFEPTGVNYLWRGNAEYWGKFSPVLFPIVGGLKDETYFYEGKSYHLPRHGFARDMDFEVEESAENRAVFSLTYTEETLLKYPFRFKLVLAYELKGSALSCTYHVSNLDDQNMFFSIGGHPAFAVPLNGNGNYNDYQLHFNNDESITFHQIEDNLISDQTTTLSLPDGDLKLEHELFYQDALVFKNLKSTQIDLKNSLDDHGLSFEFEDFQFFGIWSAKDADFVCLEPWCGVADGINHNQQLTDKEGIIDLSPNSTWSRTWQVTCF